MPTSEPGGAAGPVPGPAEMTAAPTAGRSRPWRPWARLRAVPGAVRRAARSRAHALAPGPVRARAPVRAHGRARARGAWRAALVLPLGLLLSGCLDTPQGGQGYGAFRQVDEDRGGFGFIARLRRPLGPVLVSAVTASGDVVIRGPADYCIEGRSLETGPDGGFALLARCDILSGGQMGNPVALALLTATVAPHDGTPLPSAADLAADFAERDVLAARDREEVRLLHLGQGGDTLIDRADPRQWRAAFLLNGYVVTLAAYGPEDSSVAGAGGQSLLLAMARAIRAASPDSPGARPDEAPAGEVTAEAPRSDDDSPGLGSTVNVPGMED